MGCYYGFEKRANDLATHGINRFAYANRRLPCWAQKQRKPLRTKTFAYANGEFPYANPGRGDVSPLQPMRSIVFFFGCWIPPGNLLIPVRPLAASAVPPPC